MVEPKCPNLYGVWSCTKVNWLVSYSDETVDRWVLITGAYCNPCTWIRCQAVWSTYFVPWTEYTVLCRWIFRSEARLVTIPSINSVRQHNWLRRMNSIQVYHTKYGLQSTNSAHNTTAPQHALQVSQVVISMPIDPPGFTMACVYCIQSSRWWNRIIRRGNGWIHDIHRCWRLVGSYSMCK